MNKKWLLLACALAFAAALNGMDTGKDVAKMGTDKTVRILDQEVFNGEFFVECSPDSRYILTLKRRHSTVVSFVLNPNVKVANSSIVSIWDAHTGLLIHEWNTDKWVGTVKYFPDGKFVLVKFEGSVGVLNASTGRPVVFKAEKAE